jgi:glucuronate isomerase
VTGTGTGTASEKGRGARPLELHPDRLFPPDTTTRAIARELYAEVATLPIISPHGHTDPRWFAHDEPFGDPTALLIIPDHYLTRMLYSQGVPLEALGVGDERAAAQPRDAWRTFADHYHLFRGTPSGLWFDYVLADVFGISTRLDHETADATFDAICDALARSDFRPRALFERFGIEVIATTESPTDPLDAHEKLAADGWGERVITTFRPDPVVDPDFDNFAQNVAALGEITGRDTTRWSEYLHALRDRRAFFAAHGATATDHGHPTAATANLPASECQRLLSAALRGRLPAQEAEAFRAHMLTEMARMSLDDGLVMQLHPGSQRNHNPLLHERFGRDKGADIPARTDYVNGLRPLLDEMGNDPRLRLIVFTLDESTYTRELAPLAGHYPCLVLGPPWWFLDSVEGMRRFRRAVTETAGFANTAGFNDDTRAFLSIPARHDVARRVDCGYLAELVADHRVDITDARELAVDLAYGLAKRAYRLDASR